MKAGYFQVQLAKYETNAWVSDKTGVAFKFQITPDGHGEQMFAVSVMYPLHWFGSKLGKRLVKGGPFLTDEEKPKLMRLASHLLRKRLEESNLNELNHIIVDDKLIEQSGIVSQKQCEYLTSNGRDWLCLGISTGESLPISYALCEECCLPEPLLRCDNMKLVKTTGDFDSKGRLHLAATCYCITGEVFPDMLDECANRKCFVPYRFYPRKPRRRLGFQPPRLG